mgnify:CR=1 FL=1
MLPSLMVKKAHPPTVSNVQALLAKYNKIRITDQISLHTISKAISKVETS